MSGRFGGLYSASLVQPARIKAIGIFGRHLDDAVLSDGLSIREIVRLEGGDQEFESGFLQRGVRDRPCPQPTPNPSNSAGRFPDNARYLPDGKHAGFKSDTEAFCDGGLHRSASALTSNGVAGRPPTSPRKNSRYSSIRRRKARRSASLRT